jgi:hypothetical protein
MTGVRAFFQTLPSKTDETFALAYSREALRVKKSVSRIVLFFIKKQCCAYNSRRENVETHHLRLTRFHSIRTILISLGFKRFSSEFKNKDLLYVQKCPFSAFYVALLFCDLSFLFPPRFF